MIQHHSTSKYIRKSSKKKQNGVLKNHPLSCHAPPTRKRFVARHAPSWWTSANRFSFSWMALVSVETWQSASLRNSGWDFWHFSNMAEEWSKNMVGTSMDPYMDARRKLTHVGCKGSHFKEQNSLTISKIWTYFVLWDLIQVQSLKTQSQNVPCPRPTTFLSQTHRKSSQNCHWRRWSQPSQQTPNASKGF